MLKHFDYNIYCNEQGTLFKQSGKRLKVDNRPKYPTVTFYNRGRKVTKSVHRLVAECYNGASVETVHHCNHNTHDFRPNNLAIVNRVTHNLIEVKGWKVESNLM